MISLKNTLPLIHIEEKCSNQRMNQTLVRELVRGTALVTRIVIRSGFAVSEESYGPFSVISVNPYRLRLRDRLLQMMMRLKYPGFGTVIPVKQ